MTDTRYLVVTPRPPYTQVVWAKDTAAAISKAAEMIDSPDTMTAVEFTVQDYPESVQTADSESTVTVGAHRAEKPWDGLAVAACSRCCA